MVVAKFNVVDVIEEGKGVKMTFAYVMHCGMIFFQLIVTISFDLLDPFVANGFPTFWKYNKLPCLVFM